ncbi:MAG: conserved membrane protein of unknown function [Candidatus Thorarchaeota archaeon]|nr:MAG: conserved membrane protein of unknown function [Candidatus Thorarchaeota archaeon]
MQIMSQSLEIATVIMIVESILFIAIAIGWYFGARRMYFDLHHKAVYSVVLIHSITVGAWMIPRAATLAAEGAFTDLAASWYQIVHDLIGIFAIIFGIVLALIFLTRKDMPLDLLKKTRPIMILTLILWTASYLLGIIAYVVQLMPGAS